MQIFLYLVISFILYFVVNAFLIEVRNHKRVIKNIKDKSR